MKMIYIKNKFLKIFNYINFYIKNPISIINSLKVNYNYKTYNKKLYKQKLHLINVIEKKE
jgi:hypothetical protein